MPRKGCTTDISGWCSGGLLIVCVGGGGCFFFSFSLRGIILFVCLFSSSSPLHIRVERNFVHYKGFCGSMTCVQNKLKAD